MTQLGRDTVPTLEALVRAAQYPTCPPPRRQSTDTPANRPAVPAPASPAPSSPAGPRPAPVRSRRPFLLSTALLSVLRGLHVVRH